MTDRYLVEEFDPQSASDDDFRARWQASVALSQELEPEEPVTPLDKYRLSMVDQLSFRRPRHWAVWDGERQNVIGTASIELEYVDTNRNLAWFDIGVLADARRHGIGTALLKAITDVATGDDRTMLGSGTIEGTAGDEFATAVGLEKKATERKSRLTIPSVDRAMLERWVERVSERATDYELVTYDNRCPDELLDAFVDLKFVTNTAPRDDLEMEDWKETPEQFREKEEKSRARGDQQWCVIARHKETGELAGFTDFFFAPYAKDVAWQGWTAVRETHRNRGLGRWIKAVNCLRLMDERPEVVAVDTWNAFSNEPMLGINIEMGFELIRGYNEWQAPTDRLASAAKERLGG